MAPPTLLEPHTSVSFYHPTQGYISGTITEILLPKNYNRDTGKIDPSAKNSKRSQKSAVIKYRISSQHMSEDTIDVKQKYVYETKFIQQAQQEGSLAHDLLEVLDLNEASLQVVVEDRFLRDDIYTFIGPIVLAFNPFKWDIPHVQDDQMVYYMNQKRGLRPHSWSVADDAYRSMMRGEGNQSILVSGISGAGKTEASKTVAKYLSALSTSMTTDADRKKFASGIATKIQESSPILEAFGNAKTINNDNSSRFGKFIKLQFDRDGVILGATIVQYLLERSRVIAPGPNERSYHIFYQMLAGASDQERDLYQLGKVEDFPSLTAGDCTSVDTINDIEEYRNTRAAMDIIGVTSEEQSNVFSVLASILHLNRLLFQQDEDDQAFVENRDPLLVAARLLHVSPDLLEQVLVTKKLVIMNNTIIKKLNADGAVDARDALMKALYVNLFNWLIDKINEKIAAPSQGVHSFIGLLDIFGFEEFEVNSFEQLCINFSNEALQHHYNSINFKRDMKECKDEGIDVTSVKFNDNTPCIELIKGSKSQSGILDLLDAQCSFPKATDQSFHNLTKNTFFKKHKYFDINPVRHEEFYVRHFAGKIEYNTKYWLDKNKDLLKDDILEMLQGSSNKFVSTLVPPPIRVKGKLLTVGGHFKNQLNELLTTVNSTLPHWIRCIKPHPSKRPNRFHRIEVMNQLRSSGVLATIKMRREGFSVRLPHKHFWDKFRVLIGEGDIRASDKAKLVEGCKRILDELNKSTEEAQVGKTKVFLRPHAYSALEKVRGDVLADTVTQIQNFARMSMAMKRVADIRHQIKMEKLRKEVARRKKEIDLIRSIKEEREFINTDLARKNAAFESRVKGYDTRREEILQTTQDEIERLLAQKRHLLFQQQLRAEEEKRAAEERARLIAALEEEKRQREEEAKRRIIEAKLEKERVKREKEEKEREMRRQEIIRLEREATLQRRKELEEQQLNKIMRRSDEQQRCIEEHERNKNRARRVFEQQRAEQELLRQEEILRKKERRDRRKREEEEWERQEYQRLKRELYLQKHNVAHKHYVDKKRRVQVKQTQKLKEYYAQEKKKRIHEKMLRTAQRRREIQEQKQEMIRMKKEQHEYRQHQVLTSQQEQERYLAMKQEELDQTREREKKIKKMKKQIQHELGVMEVHQSWQDKKIKERDMDLDKSFKLKQFEDEMERRKSLDPLNASSPDFRMSSVHHSADLTRSSPLTRGFSLDLSQVKKNGLHSARSGRSRRSVSPTDSVHSARSSMSTTSRNSLYDDIHKAKRKRIPKAGTFSLYTQ
eukprot:CAMPEP_0117441274 /NCGR_PEP_ID=MMETSP0759-20121206/3551_1 /TAXON_ID=63605 /ORGANISM="Percolomonas cosmopolitus, Strain WS" /LENGTH=1285 /DNA_ID=CAMNT_0005233125 /DNA_START=408 /DNA_END=4265 /DNA_ORIENTATION=-